MKAAKVHAIPHDMKPMAVLTGRAGCMVRVSCKPTYKYKGAKKEGGTCLPESPQKVMLHAHKGPRHDCMLLVMYKE